MKTHLAVYAGFFLPLLGTTLGAALVFPEGRLRSIGKKAFTNGFAAGVMLASSIWSLMLPALEEAASWAFWSFIPPTVGCICGLLFLRLTDRVCRFCERDAGPGGKNTGRTLFCAVTIHNLPEGMAVGIIWAGFLSGRTDITITGALALSIGIALQNIPEGAIVSTPVFSRANSKGKRFLLGVASGIVEPVGAFLTLGAFESMLPLMPWLLGFAAGTMLCAVVEELIPSCMMEDGMNKAGICGFFCGFLLMMCLDTVL